jgi:GDP-L-fucose synthase
MKRIMITGGTGFLGRALVRELASVGYLNLTPLSSKDGDLREKQVANDLMKYHKPNIVIHLAAHVGGIGANMEKPGEFFYDNITMGVNLIDAANWYSMLLS